MASGLEGRTCVSFVKEQNYVFASCNFVPVDGVEYFPGICWREMYVLCFFVSRKQTCGEIFKLGIVETFSCNFP